MWINEYVLLLMRQGGIRIITILGGGKSDLAGVYLYVFSTMISVFV